MRIVVVLLFFVANSYSVSIKWLEDSYSAFSVTLSGTGISHDDPIQLSSPSGLWEFDMRQWGLHFPDFNPNHVVMGQGGALLFRETPPPDIFVGDFPDRGLALNSFEEFVPIGSPLTVGEGWHGSFVWGGVNHLTITSTPDLSDPSTWTWISSYEAHGPSLSVPESGGILCFGFALLSLLLVSAFSALRIPKA